MNDADLVAQVQAGDTEAFAELIRRHHASLHGLCLSLLHDPSASDDAAQEIFLKAFRRLPQFRKDAAFSTWLYRIAYHHCLDLLRSQSRRKTESLDAILEAEGGNPEKMLASPENTELSQENADLVHRVLSCLPPDYRLILTLRELQGLSYQELADVLDCSLDAVKAKLRRARLDFEEHLRHFWNAAIV